MESNDVVKLYKLFEENGIEVWIDGGWGIDALLGEQTRPHQDLDIAPFGAFGGRGFGGGR